MKRTVSLAVAALVIAAAASVSAIAQPPQGFGRGPGRGMGPGGPGPFGMLQRLDLTEEQRTQIRAIVDERKDVAPDQSLMDLQKQLHEAIFADTPDKTVIGNLTKAISAAHAAALQDHVALQVRIAQILTPEQRQQAREFQGRRGGPGAWGAARGPDPICDDQARSASLAR